MYGKGTFVDRAPERPEKFPGSRAAGSANKRDTPDLITSKLAALHFYQLAIPAPEPPKDSYDEQARRARRGRLQRRRQVRDAATSRRCSREPGWPMHTAEEIGIDDFQSSRSPDRMYRTTPLRGPVRAVKGGFYHDGRFADLTQSSITTRRC